MRQHILIFLLGLCFFGHAQLSSDIKINQIGFYPSEIKRAVITAPVHSDSFYVVGATSPDTLFSGKLANPRRVANSSRETRIADFTKFRRKGSFRLVVPGVGTSYVFRIQDHVFHGLNIMVLKAFYYQRASMAIEEKFAGKWARPLGHPDTVVFVHPSAADRVRPALSIISTPGGWYDAGDYNKYIVNSGITMATLFSAYEDFPDYLTKLKTNIPEANHLPDILNEAIFNLRWMLTMQDPSDGGVYHKCTNATFDPMIMPAEARTKRYVVEKTTAATLDFSAVMAQASRILMKIKSGIPLLSDSCLKAAVKAWEWALKNKFVYYDQEALNKKFQPSIMTGAYGDKNLRDEWFWSAAELFKSTRQSKYRDVLIASQPMETELPSWNNVDMLGYCSLARLAPEKGLPGSLLKGARDSIVRMAEKIISYVSQNAFATVMGDSGKDFIWGSNSVAANKGILLIKAYLLTGNKKYTEAASQTLDYILGRNATGYCFVTGAGSRSPKHPHHRLSVADGIEDPVPGFLVGGPNPGQQDKCPYPFSEPDISYVDSSCAYACNEIAINWNAPLVYLVTALEAIHG